VSGTPYVLTAHLGDVPGGTPEKTGGWFHMIYPFTPPIWKRAARVTAVSDFTRSLALARYPVTVEVIPNGVDLQEAAAGAIVANQPPVVVFAGRFMQQKNVVQIARVMNRLADQDWRCLMLGDGPLKPEVEEEIARGGCAQRFELPGWVTPQQVLDAFGRADILFMPSYSEGLPVVGVQAMAKGLALALSSAGGNPELVQEGRNGILLAPEDEAGYEEALRGWLSSPETLLAARQASRELAQRFDLVKIIDAYEQVLRAAARSAGKNT
jgi:glycosyltransferase involved in cell wall biosynthesis